MGRIELRDRVLERNEPHDQALEILRAMGGRSWGCGGGLVVLVLQDRHLWPS
jgi:hypothetical protein